MNLKGVFWHLGFLSFVYVPVPLICNGKKYILTGLRCWCPTSEVDQQCKCRKHAAETKLMIFDAYISLGFMLELSGYSKEERVQQRSARAAARAGEERE